MVNMQDISKPKGKGRLSTNEILSGQIIPAIDRLSTISEDDFEDLVLEWADGYLSKKYDKVREFGGAGDKGRDVVGYYPEGQMDFFQCKRYAVPLSPSQIWIELGKIIYYSFDKHYKSPKTYYFVTSKGVGPKLLDLIEKPEQINQKLIDEWDDKCKNKIKATPTILSDELKDYIVSFDFSIIKDKSPLELISEHRQTIYYSQRFGGGLVKYRDVIPSPLMNVQAHELPYTNLLYTAYSKHTNHKIDNKAELEKISIDLGEHFEEERTSFYCAESLEKFSRDNFADFVKLPFEEMKEDSLVMLKSLLRLSTHSDDLNRLEESKLQLMNKEFTSNPLHREIRNLDKAGMCHYLANENKIKWEK